ncbi:hypothetical protein C1646_757957 [Rhizophagus diaphanus]|nr:hypothetical protein C1646_757957 [Rhizophagus diaphanus] [Rhizophagus sp. MUCL 43196]
MSSIYRGFLQQIHNTFNNIFTKKSNKVEINCNSDLNICEVETKFEFRNKKGHKESEDKGDYESDYENEEDDYESEDEGDYESDYESESEVNYESNYESEDYESEDKGDCERARQLHNLAGVWQVDRDAINKASGILTKLGDKGYTRHSWHLAKQNIQIPCIGQYMCEALKVCHPLCIQALDDIKRPKSICCLCYEKLGGLEFLGNWLIDISQTQDEEINKQILIALTSVLIPFTSFPFNKTFIESNLSHTNISTNPDTINTNIYSTSVFTSCSKFISTQPPSLFMIKILFIEFFKKMNDGENFLKINDLKEFGCIIENKLWNSYSEITTKKSFLESPKTIYEYYNAFPDFLTSFFSGIINKLQEKKMEITNCQRKKRQKSLITTICHKTTTKIVTFITSILTGIAFPSFKIWLPQVMASLNRKPQLLGSLRQLLTTDPTQRLIEGKNIWNLAIIDNIDFKEKTFKFGNIYDVT